MSDLIDAILSLTDVYDKYGIKGCAIFILGIALVIGAIIALAYWLG
ncbi:hypothetical protein ANRL3_02980 [Anaerolineae bacterium]|nr:hypothetical protein ANRL3_02980 [Anaerolineae bacterium]